MRGVRFAASFRVPSGGDAVFLTNRHKLEADAALTLIKQGARQVHASSPGLKRALLKAAGGAALLICDQSAAWADCTPSAANDIAANPHPSAPSSASTSGRMVWACRGASPPPSTAPMCA